MVLTQKAIKDGKTEFQVMVDSEVSKENVIRCVERNKMSASVSEEGDIFTISVTK